MCTFCGMCMVVREQFVGDGSLLHHVMSSKLTSAKYFPMCLLNFDIYSLYFIHSIR